VPRVWGPLDNSKVTGWLMVPSYLQSALDRTADAAFVTNSEGFICAWNRKATELFEYSTPEALNVLCSKLLSCRTALDTRVCGERCGVISNCLVGRNVPNFDMKVKVRSGRWIWINVSILVFDDERINRCLVAHLGRDITRRKEAESLNQQLIQAAKRIARFTEEANSLPPTAPLTGREQTILQALSSGKSPKTVCRDLGITAGTLRNHLHHVNQKLGTHNRLQAITQAKCRSYI